MYVYHYDVYIIAFYHNFQTLCGFNCSKFTRGWLDWIMCEQIRVLVPTSDTLAYIYQLSQKLVSYDLTTTTLGEQSPHFYQPV